MTLRERLGTWIAGKRLSGSPIGFHPPSTEFGQGIGHQPAAQTLLNQSLGVSARATRAIANRVGSLNPLVKISRRSRAGTLEDEIIDDHPLKRLLDRPHPDLSRSQLLKLTAQYVLTVGAAYWLKVGNGLRRPAELHPIPPQHVQPILRSGVVAGYAVSDGQGRRTVLLREQVVRFYIPDPESFWTGEGYLGPAGITADSMKFAGEHLRKHYQEDATPKWAMKPGEGATAMEPGTDLWSRFLAQWRRRYQQREGTDTGGPGILPTGYDIHEFALQTGAEMTPLLEFWRDEQLMDFGVPRSVLGQVVSGDRSSAETNAYVFDLHTVTPVAGLIADSLTLQLAPDFDTSIWVAFDEFVADDKRFRLEQEKTDVAIKVRSPQQILRDRGMDPEDAPWGEFPPGTLADTPYTGEAMDFDLPSDEEGALGDDEPMGEGEEPEDEEPRSRKREPDALARQAWQRQVAAERRWVPPMLRAVRGILRLQRDDVLVKLREGEPRARQNVDDLFRTQDWSELFELRVEPLRAAAFQQILGETLLSLGQDAEFVLTEEMRKILREQGAQLIDRANRTTRKRIAEALEASVVAGEGADQTAKRITQVFQVRRREARTIARTEILKASQKAQIQGFETSGVVARKRWNTSLDAAVRDTHAATNGQIVGLREPFILGDGEPAEAPGLGAGGGPLSAHNAINCRCFVTPVLEG